MILIFPYYSVAAPDQPVNGVTHFLERWSASGAEFEDASAGTTAVIFRQNNAAVTAHMKAHLASNTNEATAFNNGRKVVEDDNGRFHLVYKDNGDIWYGNSTDNGASWSNEERVSLSANNTSPSIAYHTGLPNYGVVWDRKEGGNHFPVFRYKPSFSSPFWVEIFADPADNVYAPADCKPAITHARPPGNTRNLAYWIACRVNNGNNKIGIGLLRGGDFVEESGEEPLTWIGLLPGTNANSDNPTIAAEDPQAPVIHFAWEQKNAIYYSNYDGEGFLNPPDEVTAEFTDLQSNNLPSISVSSADQINLVWQAIEEGGVETLQALGSGGRLECPPPSIDNPVVCFRQKQSGSWGALQVFITKNTCDRKPVFTSWPGVEGEDYALAYEGALGRIDYILGENGDPGSPLTLTTDGANPALAVIGSTPHAIWNEFEAAPYRIQHSDELVAGLEVTESPPHSRRVYFTLNKAFPNIQLDANMILQISDPVFFNNGVPQPIKPQYRDTLLKGDNAFVFQSLAVTNSNSKLQVPVQVKALDIRLLPKGSRSVRPFLRLNVKNANNNQILNTIYTYKTDTLAGDTLILRDTFNVDLSDFVGQTILLEGETFFEKGTNVQFAEVYDLRRSPPQRVYATTTGEPAPAIAPKQFSLSQNYPNPFNPETIIRFTLPEAASVALDVFDITGRHIKTLANHSMEAGEHQLIWNGKDELGNQVSSGVYF